MLTPLLCFSNRKLFESPDALVCTESVQVAIILLLMVQENDLTSGEFELNGHLNQLTECVSDPFVRFGGRKKEQEAATPCAGQLASDGTG